MQKQTTEPHRIYGWLNTQLSIARHYGGCEINGKSYAIRYDLEGQPLEEILKKPKVKKLAKEDVLRDMFKEIERGNW